MGRYHDLAFTLSRKVILASPNLFLILIFWPCRMACRILVPRPGIEPVPPAVEVQSLNHWTAREVLAKPNLLSVPSRVHIYIQNYPFLSYFTSATFSSL